MSIHFPNSSGALSLGACPDKGHVNHSPGSDIRAQKADGLLGDLGMYEIEVNGKTQLVSELELEALRRGNCTGGGQGKVVRSDNYRELLNESVQDVKGRSLTDDALDAVARQVGLSGGPNSPFAGSDARLQGDFDARVAAQGRTTVKIEGFDAPGWEAADSEAACFKLACQGANSTAAIGESATGGGGVILYDKVAQRIKTDTDASRLALDQIKAHIDSGRAVVAGVNEPSEKSVIDKKTQPVTDHFLAVYGYEMDSTGRVTALLAKDNAVSGTAEVRFEVRADGSIVKPKEPGRAEEEKYLRQEYQMSEVRFHDTLKYTGTIRPTNDAGKSMVWQPKA